MEIRNKRTNIERKKERKKWEGGREKRRKIILNGKRNNFNEKELR